MVTPTEIFPPTELNPARGRRNSGKSAQTSTTSFVNTGGNRKRKIGKLNPLHSYKDLGRWKPVDDLLLVQGVLQVK